MKQTRCAIHEARSVLHAGLAALCLALVTQTASAQTGNTVSPPNQLPPHNLAAGDPGYGGEASDTVITAHAKAALMAADGVTSSDVHVTTKRGAITLTGTVPDEGQRDRAESAVHDLNGVVSVTNNLRVGKPQ